MMTDTNDTDMPEGIEFPKFKLSDFSEIAEDAVIVQASEASGKKMSKEELIAKGLLPPKKKQSTDAVIQEIPVEQMLNQEVPPKSTYANEQDDPLFRKASTRMGMALDLIKIMVAGPKQDVNDMVQYAFAIADAIQNEADRGYHQDLINRAMGKS